MKLVIFGATGATGVQLVQQALSLRHEVTAFVRSPDALAPVAGRVRLVTGDATQDRAAVAEAVEGQDVVISALGRGKVLKSEDLIARSMRLIVSAMEQARVRRLIVMSSFGVGESYARAPLIPRMMFRFLLRDIFADKQAGEERIRGSALDWTLVYPVYLTNGPLTSCYRVGEHLELRGLPKVSRADVAHFILSEAERPAFVRKTAVVSY